MKSGEDPDGDWYKGTGNVSWVFKTIFMDFARRFSLLCEDFDSIINTFNYPTDFTGLKRQDWPRPSRRTPYLIVYLRFLISDAIDVNCRDGTAHSVRHNTVNEGRITLSRRLCRAILNAHGYTPKFVVRSKDMRVEGHWLTCYIENILPDQTLQDWEYFECSHRCISYNLGDDDFCVDKDCIVWESKSVNQSRGYGLCWRDCGHCNNILCYCQELHDPPCK
jgi:hypothetical protein